jgi:hypothetical protein
MCEWGVEMRNIPALIRNPTLSPKHLCAAMDHIIRLAKPTLALAR